MPSISQRTFFNATCFGFLKFLCAKFYVFMFLCVLDAVDCAAAHPLFKVFTALLKERHC